MPFSPSPDQLHILLFEADAAARRLTRQLRLPRHDLDDVKQDLIADALARLRSFDPARGSIGAFLATVMAHKATRIARRVVAERRAFGFEPVSIDAPASALGPDATTIGETLSEEAGLGAFWGQADQGVAASARRMDVDRCLGALDPHDSALCVALAQRTVNELAATGSGSRAGLYRRIRELRSALVAHGLQPA